LKKLCVLQYSLTAVKVKLDLKVLKVNLKLKIAFSLAAKRSLWKLYRLLSSKRK